MLEREERKKEREELAKKKAESRLKKAAEKSLTKKPPARKRVSQLSNHKKQQKKPLYLNPLRLSQLLLNPLHLLPSHQNVLQIVSVANAYTLMPKMFAMEQGLSGLCVCVALAT